MNASVTYPYWQAVIYNTLNPEHAVVEMRVERAHELRAALRRGFFYYMTFEAGLDLEIVRVVSWLDKGVLRLERGLAGCYSGVWPAGTALKAILSASSMRLLHLEPEKIVHHFPEAYLTNFGDLITKTALMSPSVQTDEPS